MKTLKSLLAKIVKPLTTDLLAKEPALAASAAGAAVELAAHYGLNLSAGQQAWVTGIVIGAVGFVVRQSVTALGNIEKK